MTLNFILFKNNHILNQSTLTKNFTNLQKCFHNNYLVLNLGKCYFMTFGSNKTKNEFVLQDVTIVPSVEEHVVLGITIDSRLTFSHLKQLCKKAANKLNALTRMSHLSITKDDTSTVLFLLDNSTTAH